MAVNINDFKSYTEFISNKIQSGGTLTVPQFNQVAFQAEMQLFNKDYETFVTTNNITEFLKTFLKNKILPVNSAGEASFPTDFQYTASIRHYYVPIFGSAAEVEVKQVKNESWGEIQISQLLKPTRRFPKYQEFSDKFLLLPRTIGSVTLDYFKTPTAPVWGFTVVNGRPVYNSATSTNFEFSEAHLNSVAAIFLSLIGINLREQELVQFSEMYKQQTTNVL